MKWHLIILLLPSKLFSQEKLPIKDGKVGYEYIDSVDKQKDEIFSKSLMWLANNFKNSNVVNRLENNKDGEYIGKGAFTFKVTNRPLDAGYTAHFTIHISARDKKYRLQMYDIQFSENSFNDYFSAESFQKAVMKKHHQRFIKEVNSEFDSINTKLYTYLVDANDKF